MRDPATTVDLAVEAAIGETREILECYMRFDYWKADPPKSLAHVWSAIKEIPGSNLSDRAKNAAVQALFEQTKKRQRKSSRRYRDNALCVAAGILVSHGYNLTRSEATDHTESASSIIHKALKKLSVPPKNITEKHINNILLHGHVLKYPLTKPA